MPRHFYVPFLISLCLGIALLTAAHPGPDELDIPPVNQQTPVWCWAATAEMVLEYYKVPDLNPFANFQCAIAALVSPPCRNNCGNCIVGAPNMAYLRKVLMNYPAFAAKYSGHPVPAIVADYPTGPLTETEVRSEIKAKRPIVVGISPSGFTYGGQPEHVSLIVGYDESGDDFLLTVNDPFPYDAVMFHSKNPYVEAGGEEVELEQYSIAYDAFRKRLHWTQSIAGIRSLGSQISHMCVTQSGACPMSVAVPPGQGCYCVTVQGPIPGISQ